jgi:hypothetical protein
MIAQNLDFVQTGIAVRTSGNSYFWPRIEKTLTNICQKYSVPFSNLNYSQRNKIYAPRLIPEQARLPVAFQKQIKTKKN